MDAPSTVSRDLTDSAQNQAVLDAADELLTGRAGVADLVDRHGAAVAAEAQGAARSRRRLAGLDVPVHLSVVWAMYRETGRMRPGSEHPHGEDLVRAKAAQLDWLCAGLTGITWSILACDDGCPDEPSSAEVMSSIIAAEGWPQTGHRGVRVIRLADLIGSPATAFGPAFAALDSTDDSRKGGSILAALRTAADQQVPDQQVPGRHVLAYTDADLSANLAQLGSLVAPVAAGAAGALGQRYGLDEAVLVKQDGPVREPHSTGDKPDRMIVLFRHMVRATLIPSLAHVLDTQAGFKAFDAAALGPVLPRLASFDETFDVELLILLAQQAGADALAVEPIVFTEDFAATNFPSVDPGARHLAMVTQVVDLYDRLVADVHPATGEAAALLDLLRGLDLDGYVRIIEYLREQQRADPGAGATGAALFAQRWSAQELRAALGRG